MRKLILFLGILILPTTSLAYWSPYTSSSYNTEMTKYEYELEEIKACSRSENAYWDIGYDTCKCREGYTKFYTSPYATGGVNYYKIPDSLSCVPNDDVSYIRIDDTILEKRIVLFTISEDRELAISTVKNGKGDISFLDVKQGASIVANASFSGATQISGCDSFFMKKGESYAFVEKGFMHFLSDVNGGHCELFNIAVVDNATDAKATSEVRREMQGALKGKAKIEDKKEALAGVLEKYKILSEKEALALSVYKLNFKHNIVLAEIKKLEKILSRKKK